MAYGKDWLMSNRFEMTVCLRSVRDVADLVLPCQKSVKIYFVLVKNIAVKPKLWVWLLKCFLEPFARQGKATTNLFIWNRLSVEWILKMYVMHYE